MPLGRVGVLQVPFFYREKHVDAIKNQARSDSQFLKKEEVTAEVCLAAWPGGQRKPSLPPVVNFASLFSEISFIYTPHLFLPFICLQCATFGNSQT
jgi:hypothetical protein